MIRAITVFRDQCKKKLFIGTYCVGVELNQFFPKFVEVTVGERVEKRYKNPHDFIISAHHFSSTNAFSKQTLNYGRRAKQRF